jgi:hypothetical protein
MIKLLDLFSEKRRRRIEPMTVVLSALVASVQRMPAYVTDRDGNLKRDRARVELKIRSMRDVSFKRMYRLDKPAFYRLLAQIRPDLELNAMGQRMATV